MLCNATGESSTLRAAALDTSEKETQSSASTVPSHLPSTGGVSVLFPRTRYWNKMMYYLMTADSHYVRFEDYERKVFALEPLQGVLKPKWQSWWSNLEVMDILSWGDEIARDNSLVN